MPTEITQLITDCLSTNYLIHATDIVLLPIGADINASIYKVKSSDQKTYFVKLKKDFFNDTHIKILELLQKAGVKELIAPLKNVESKWTCGIGDKTLIVYPFILGHDGFSRALTYAQWIELGQALRQVHEIDVPSSLKMHIRQEDFSPSSQNAVRSLYADNKDLVLDNKVALDLWKFLQENRSLVEQLVNHAEELSKKAQCQRSKFVLCHSDIHAGNILLDTKDALYIVDWDEPILAPKERDLMFIGGGVGNVWNKPFEEELFYQGYGQVEINWTLLAYYRFERIVVDIAEYAQELLLKSAPTNDKSEMYKHFLGMFATNGVVDIAFATANRIVK
jgi:spectinomycin phosphotransferase